MRGAEPDIVREERRAIDIVVPVDRVGAPDHRHLDRHVGRHRRAVIVVGQLQPVADAGVHVHARPGAAAVEDRAEIIAADIVGRDRADVGLGHLPDLLLERHSGDDRADARFDRGLGRTAAGTAARGQSRGRRLARGQQRRERTQDHSRPSARGLVKAGISNAPRSDNWRRAATIARISRPSRASASPVGS